MNSFVYVQISVRPHGDVRVSIVKERWVTTRDHSQELPVDLFLLFTNRLCKDDRDRRSQQKKQVIEGRHFPFVLISDLLCSAVGPARV